MGILREVAGSGTPVIVFFDEADSLGNRGALSQPGGGQPRHQLAAMRHVGDVALALSAFETLLGPNTMLAYLSMMAPRLIELRRVLKPEGSLYLHCDPTASHYLKMVLDSLDNHPVLAYTAYNAGPGRARRWRGEQPLEGAIYAETIPFAETRDYVKKVMANSVYYSALFEEKPQSLKPRLGIIGPRSDAPKGEDLP